MYFVEEKKS